MRSLRELQKAKIDDTEQLIQSFIFSEIFLSSCEPFQNSHLSLIRSESFRELQKTAADDIEKLIQKLQLFKNISELMQALANNVKFFTLLEEQKTAMEAASVRQGRPPRVKIN